MLCGICIVQIPPRKHALDYADYTAPTRQNELDHTTQEIGLPLKYLDHPVELDYLSDVWNNPAAYAGVHREILSNKNGYTPGFFSNSVRHNYFRENRATSIVAWRQQKKSTLQYEYETNHIG